MLVALVFLLGHVAVEARTDSKGFFSKEGFLFKMEYAALDAKMQARGNLPLDPKVVVAKVDEKSIDRFGLWPWNRTRIAELIDALTAQGAKVIGFDMIFSDVDKNSTYLELKRYKEIYDEAGLYRPVQPATLGVASEKVNGALARIEKLEKELKKPQLGPVAADLRATKQALASYEENCALLRRDDSGLEVDKSGRGVGRGDSSLETSGRGLLYLLVYGRNHSADPSAAGAKLRAHQKIWRQ